VFFEISRSKTWVVSYPFTSRGRLGMLITPTVYANGSVPVCLM